MHNYILVKNVPVFLYAVTMLVFQIKRIISSEKWFNYIVTFFFWKMTKIWVSQTMLKYGENKRGWPYSITCKLKMLLQIKNRTCKLKIVHAN